MNKDATHSLEDIKWLLGGLVKFHPHHFSEEEALYHSSKFKGQDYWPEWDPETIESYALEFTHPHAKSLPEAIEVLNGWLNKPAEASIPIEKLEGLVAAHQETLSSDPPGVKKGRYREYLRNQIKAARSQTKTAEVVYLAPEAPAPTAPAPDMDVVREMANQIHADKEAWVRNLEAGILNKRPDLPRPQAQRLSEAIATRIEDYASGKPSLEAALSGFATNAEVFEKQVPEPETRAKILDLAQEKSSQLKGEEELARQILPTVVPEAKIQIVDVIYSPTRQSFKPTLSPTPGAVAINSQNLIDRAERATPAGADFSDVVTPVVTSTPSSQPPAPPTLTAKAPEKIYLAISQDISPDASPEIRDQVKNLATEAVNNPQMFEADVREKLIQSSDFSSQFTSPEGIADAADYISKDLTTRLTDLEKGAPPTLNEIASSSAILTTAIPNPVERQNFIATSSASQDQIKQVIPVVASSLGIKEEVLSEAYRPRQITISETPSQGLFEVVPGKLIPAAEGNVPLSDAITSRGGASLTELKLQWARSEGPAQDLGIKIAYSTPPGKLSGGVSRLESNVRAQGFSFNQKNPDWTPPLVLFASGVSSSQFEGFVDQAQTKGFGPETVNSLSGVLLRLKAIEETNPFLFAEIHRIYLPGTIQLSFVEYSETPGVLALRPSDGTYSVGTPNFAAGFEFKPGGMIGNLASMGLDKLIAPAKSKILASLAKTGLGKAVKTGVTTLATGVAKKVGLAALLGSVLTPLGSAIAAVAAWIGTQLGSLFKKYSKQIAVGLIGIGLFLLSIGQTAAGLATIGGGVAMGGMGGFGSAGATVGGFFNSALGFITTVAFPAIGGPIIFSLISVPIIVALILFIINSGAYLVPPRTGLIAGLVESPYIKVEKTAQVTNTSGSCSDTGGDPSVDCENNALPLAIEYTITVTAKRGTLFNITFEHECTVIRDGTIPTCDEPLPNPIPTLISPVDPFVFTYSEIFSGNNFQDSLVIDTFSVTADTDEVQGTTSAAAASVIIGEPPTQCPQGWPVGGRFNQGAYTSYTHAGSEAIDIGANTGIPVTARHSGIARVLNGGPFGIHVEIESICPNKPFFSRYAHLSDTNVNTGDTIIMGQVIGLVGATGGFWGPHLHYEFRESSAVANGLGNPPNMLTPYIPFDLPRGCVDFVPCGSITIP